MKIIFCLPGRQFSGKFLLCWSNLLNHCLRRGIEVVISQRYDSNVYYVRTQCLGADVLRGREQKPFDGKIDYDYLMWIDSDMTFEPDNLEKLISRNLDIVGGVYLMDGGTHYAAVQDWDVEYFKKNGSFKFFMPADLVDRTEPIQVAYTGFGFLLIKHGVFESITYPWFEPHMVELGGGICDFASEDASFCNKVIDAGYAVHIDPTVKLGHEKSYVLM